MRYWMIVLLVIGWMNLGLTVNATTVATPYPLTRDCWPEDIQAPAGWMFDGVILTYAVDDGIRALRADVGTTYYIAFAGSNFVEGAGISPDGAFVAIPYGTIQTVATSDVRYNVFEMRIYDTARVPRIRRILPWSASFQYGEMPAVTWLDSMNFMYIQGSLTAEQTAVTLNPFEETPEPQPTTLGGFEIIAQTGYDALSPDTSRAVGRYQDGFGVYDTAVPEMILRLPDDVRSVRWSPDSEQFAAVVVDGDTRHLQIFNRNGEPLDVIFDFTYEQNLWNLAWSPDGTRLLFTLYDPQEHENLLYTADLNAQTVTDTCVLVSNLHSGENGASAVWSPEGNQIALITETSNSGEFQIADANSGVRHGVTGYGGGLLMWGAGE